MHRKRNLIVVGAGCLVVAGVVLVLGGCSAIVQRTSARRVPLSYFGQISAGVPVVADRRVTIPLSFSGGDYAGNSAVAPYRIKSRVSGGEIDMTVVVALVGSGSISKYQIVLSGVSPGDYTVFYRDPDGTRYKLSQIAITRP